MRLISGIVRRLDRYRRRLRPRQPSPPAPMVLSEEMGEGFSRERLAGAFRPLHDEAALAAIAAQSAADLGLVDLASGISKGVWPCFDHTVDGGKLPDWTLSPDGQTRWPLRSASSYELPRLERYGDIRLLWEKARLQELPLLIAAARAGEEAQWEDQAFSILADFREQNPVGWGPHWISGLEAALRAFSLLWAWNLARNLTGERIELLAASLIEQGRFIAAHLSVKPIANNHLIGEAAALYALGSALPCLPSAKEWRELGRELLDGQLPRQVLEDGVCGEQAIEYHRFVLELGLQALLWGRAAREDNPGWREVLARMLPPLSALTCPDGLLYALGDDDTGRVLRLDNRTRRDPSAILAAAGHLLDQSDCAPAVDGEAIWLAGPRPSAAIRKEAKTDFDAAGWYVDHFGDGGHLVFRAGPMGRGGAGHSHADLLSLGLSLGGRPIFVDGGTFLYGGELAWRDHFRSAASHSILRPHGDRAYRLLPAPDRFGWAEQPRASMSARHQGRRFRYWHGELVGGGQGALHRRLLLLPPGLLLVFDHGEQEMDLDLQWLCAPSLLPRWRERPSDGRSQIADTAYQACDLVDGEQQLLRAGFYAPENCRPFHRRGEENPHSGWYSPSYARREPTSLFGLSGNLPAGQSLVTVLEDPATASGSQLLENEEAYRRLHIKWEDGPKLIVGIASDPVAMKLDDVSVTATLAALLEDADGRTLFASDCRAAKLGDRDIAGKQLTEHFEVDPGL